MLTKGLVDRVHSDYRYVARMDKLRTGRKPARIVDDYDRVYSLLNNLVNTFALRGVELGLKKNGRVRSGEFKGMNAGFTLSYKTYNLTIAEGFIIKASGLRLSDKKSCMSFDYVYPHIVLSRVFQWLKFVADLEVREN